MDPGQITREWLESLDAAEFIKIASTIHDIQRERAEARRRKREERRGGGSGSREKAHSGRSLQLEQRRGPAGC